MKPKSGTAVSGYWFLPVYCFVAFVASVLPACSASQSPQVVKLRWLYAADAGTAFRKDLKANQLRFYAVYGYTTVIPGIGYDKYVRCYQETELSYIEGTTDAVENAEHLLLNKRADRFAREYNLLMKAHLDSSKIRTCLIEQRAGERY